MFVDNAMKGLVARMVNEYGWFFGKVFDRDGSAARSFHEGKAAGVSRSLFDREAAGWLSRLDPCSRDRIDRVLDMNGVFAEQVFFNSEIVSQKCAAFRGDADFVIDRGINLAGRLGIGEDSGFADYDLKIRAGNVTLREVLEKAGMGKDDFDHLARLAMELAPRMELFRRLSAVCAHRLESDVETTDARGEWDDDERDELKDEAIRVLASCDDWAIRQKALDEAFVVETWIEDEGEIKRHRCYDMDELPDEIRLNAIEERDLLRDRDGNDYDFYSDAKMMALDLNDDSAPMPDGSVFRVETMSARQVIRDAGLDTGKIMKEAAKICEIREGWAKRKQAPKA